MRIIEALGKERPSFSFEFFPPKTEDGDKALAATIEEIAKLDPTYVSVTYGAGGSTQAKTLEWVSRIKREFGIETMAHLTCVSHSRSEISAILDRLRKSDVENVIALRGDPPGGATQFVPHPEGLRYGSDLVELIRNRRDGFCVAGACYPEGHIECPDRKLDLEHLVEKVGKGVDFLVTQLFFDNAFYFDFVHRARAAGVTVPIIAGLMPITNVEQIERFTRMCGATIPTRLALELEKVRNDPEAVLRLGVAHATSQCIELIERGAPGIHFYTLNKAPATRRILSALRSQARVP